MALTTCRECQQSVADTAASCPHCGVRSPDATQHGRATAGDVAKVILFSVAALAVVLLVVSVLGV